MLKTNHQVLLNNPTLLLNRIEQRLSCNGIGPEATEETIANGAKGSAVLFLLTPYPANRNVGFEPCLLLNKRSQRVVQPGDLCCPGGGVERLDKLISRILRWPFSPLDKWSRWKTMKAENPGQAQALALQFATGLRESWEEMRLNPYKVRFLGPLSVQRLIMFDRVIQPLVGWIPRAQRLSANREVERIVHIPLRRLLDHHNYGRYRLTIGGHGQAVPRKDEFPCFVHKGARGEELLWGATFRIAMDFLHRVFGFKQPALDGTSVYSARLGENYLNGSLQDRGPMPREGYSDDY